MIIFFALTLTPFRLPENSYSEARVLPFTQGAEYPNCYRHSVSVFRYCCVALNTLLFLLPIDCQPPPPESVFKLPSAFPNANLIPLNTNPFSNFLWHHPFKMSSSVVGLFVFSFLPPSDPERQPLLQYHPLNQCPPCIWNPLS